ncbi:MAG TPA: threonine/serine dehydratase [Vicinamibacteria bacterium]|nr:threonine/serine dehydratase [Vicinamibacteria bacterium]
MAAWPISFEEVLAARERLRPHLVPTPLRSYPALDAEVGHGIRVFVKHENHQPTNAFKVRNGLAALSLLGEAERRRGVVSASTGNHGQGVAWAGRLLGVPVTICVPLGNNPEKNAAMRALGASVVESGRDYDEALEGALRLCRERGLAMLHSTNDKGVIAGAATLALETLEERPSLEALVMAVGGGSQAVGAMTAARGLGRPVEVFGVQSEGAPAIYESWRRGETVKTDSVRTFAEGIATRSPYELTFDTLREGLAGFVAVSEAELAEAVRVLLRITHNLVEGAGAAGLAGLMRLREGLAGREVGIVISGGNIDAATLRRVLAKEL